MAAVAVGVYFVVSGSGGSNVADDGPHKLITPAAVINGEYKKGASSGDDAMTDSDVSAARKAGVKNAKSVGAEYQSGDKNSPLTMKMLKFGGVYGQIDDPAAVVDAMFAHMKEESEKDQSGDGTKGTLVGSPEKQEPADLGGAVMKCQSVKLDMSGSGASSSGPKQMIMPVCIWGDHSTIGVAINADVASAMTGKGMSISDAAEITAKLRKDVRVKA